MQDIPRHKLASFIFAAALLIAAGAAGQSVTTRLPKLPPPAAPAVLSPDQLFASASGSVFVVEVSDPLGGHKKFGTGFLVALDGTILTNFHVIRGGAIAIVKSPDGSVHYPVTGVVAVDRIGDLALLKTVAHGKPLEIAPDAPPPVGSRVYAIGNPEGLNNTLSEGLISGIRDETRLFPLLQTTVPISHGSSGGPLLTTDGKVVGVTTLAMTEGQNLNFAVPASTINRLLARQSDPVPLETAAAPTHFEDQLELGDAWADALANQYKPAAQLLYDLGHREDNSSQYWFEAAYLKEHVRLYSDAAEDYRRALKLNPQFPAGIYLHLGSCLQSQRSYTEAIDAFRACLKYEPDNIPAWQCAAATFNQMGQPAKAIGVIQKSMHLNPADPNWYVILGNCYLTARQYPSADESFDKYTTLRPADPLGWFLLGTSHHAERDDKTARADWDKANQLDPDGPLGTIARANLQRLDAPPAFASSDPNH